MGSILFPRSKEDLAAEARRVDTFTRVKSGYEQLVVALVQMMNEQHAVIASSGGQDTSIIDNVAAVRQALFKFTLRYLAWSFVVERTTGKSVLTNELQQSLIQFLSYEASTRDSSGLYQTLRSEMYLPKSSLLALEYLSCSQLVTK